MKTKTLLPYGVKKENYIVNRFYKYSKTKNLKEEVFSLWSTAFGLVVSIWTSGT